MKKAKKSAPKRSARSAPKKKTPPRKAAPKVRPRAAPRKMAAFSAKILQEEEVPVAVRSWTEAKTGSVGGQELLPKTGEVTSTGTPAPRTPPTPDVRLDPLAGPVSVPRARNEQYEFQARTAPKRGKKAEKPEEFGQVELRQATASGGRHLTRAKPENLQRGAGRIRPLASSEEAAKPASKRESFDVPPTIEQDAKGGRAGPLPTDLLDFGDVEIGQQTRSGSRTVGKLEAEKKKRTADE